MARKVRSWSAAWLPIAAIVVGAPAACYKGYDVSKIVCQVGNQETCPEGYECRASRCCKPGDTTCGVADASSEAGHMTPAQDGSATGGVSGLDGGKELDSATDRARIDGAGTTLDSEIGDAPSGLGDAPMFALDAQGGVAVDGSTNTDDAPIGTGGAGGAGGAGGSGGPDDAPIAAGGAGGGTGGGSVTDAPLGRGGAGGIVETGGTIGTGGAIGTGGIVGTGGNIGAGGTFGAGGTIATGGTIGTGGTIDTGGTIGTGGSTASPAVLYMTGITNLGRVAVGGTGAPQTFTVRNTGDVNSETLTVSASSTQVVIASDNCSFSSLNRSESCTFGVALVPTSAVVLDATLTVSGVNADPVTVGLAGVILYPVFSLEPDLLDFGWIKVGEVSPDTTITVTNSGTLPTGPLTTSTPGNGFSVSGNTCAAALQPSETCTFAVRFAPSAAGDVSAQISVSDGTSSGSATLKASTFAHYTQISAGGSASCGVLTDGRLVCWGSNLYGQVTPPSGSFKQVSVGSQGACGLRIDGTVACWGNLDVSGVPAGSFSQVSAGGYHACALKADGDVVCWGGNSSGQGDPPTTAMGEVSAGSNHTCGRKTDGTVSCWGYNGSGQTDVPTGIVYAHVSAGNGNTCTLGTRAPNSLKLE